MNPPVSVEAAWVTLLLQKQKENPADVNNVWKCNFSLPKRISNKKVNAEARINKRHSNVPLRLFNNFGNDCFVFL